MDEAVEYRQQPFVFEHPPDGGNGNLLVDAFVEFTDIEGIAVTGSVGVLSDIAPDVLHQVVHPAVADRCCGRPDEPPMQMLVHDSHNRIYGDPVL